MNRDVFLSILAMDAYQRGYSSGINGISGVKIGNATIKHDTSELVEGGTRLEFGITVRLYLEILITVTLYLTPKLCHGLYRNSTR